MAGKNIGGVAHPLLKDSQKHLCEFCNGTLFQLAKDEADENTDLKSDTKAWKWENSAPTLPYGNMQTLKLLCQCGRLSGKLLFCLDVIGGMATPAVTATHIACTAAVPGPGGGANNLKDLYLTPLGGTGVGTSFKILSNTEADPTVITVDGAINDDVNGSVMLISSWKVF